MDNTGSFEIFPATSDRWSDIETLFGPRGACGGCWCMWWRLTRAQFEEQKGDGNHHSLHDLITNGSTPGLLAYTDGHPVGWCAVAPRSEYSALSRSRILKPVDEQPIWSIVCFFIARPARRKGLTLLLLQAAIQYARKNGATIVEGYPVEPKKEKMPDVFAFTGVRSAFDKAGFIEVARRSETRPIMRCYIDPQ